MKGYNYPVGNHSCVGVCIYTFLRCSSISVKLYLTNDETLVRSVELPLNLLNLDR